MGKIAINNSKICFQYKVLCEVIKLLIVSANLQGQFRFPVIKAVPTKLRCDVIRCHSWRNLIDASGYPQWRGTLALLRMVMFEFDFLKLLICLVQFKYAI